MGQLICWTYFGRFFICVFCWAHILITFLFNFNFNLRRIRLIFNNFYLHLIKNVLIFLNLFHRIVSAALLVTNTLMANFISSIRIMLFSFILISHFSMQITQLSLLMWQLHFFNAQLITSEWLSFLPSEVRISLLSPEKLFTILNSFTIIVFFWYSFNRNSKGAG